MESEGYFDKKKEEARVIYIAQREIYCPYLKTTVILNSDGFHHLQFSARRERDKREQLFKFSLLYLGLELIRKSATVQEYRKLLTPIGKKSAGDGSVPMKEVEYWGLVGILGENKGEDCIAKSGKRKHHILECHALFKKEKWKSEIV